MDRKSIIKTLRKISYLTRDKHKSLLLMMCLFLLTSFMEVIGIGMVGPFMALATNPDILQQNQWLNSIYRVLHLSSHNQFMLISGLLLIFIFFAKAFLNFRNQKSIFEFGFNLQAELAITLMQAYLNAPYIYHLNKNSAIIVENIANETDRFANRYMMPLLTFISNGIVTLVIVLLLVATNILATLIIAGILLVALASLNILKDRPKRWGRNVTQARIEMHRVINHGMGGLKETKVIGCEPYFEDQLREQANKFSKNASLAASFSNLPRYLIEAFLITFLILFTFLFLNANKGNPENLTSVLGVFALASIRLLPIVSGMTTTINNLKYNSHSLDVLYFDLKELEKEKSNNIISRSSVDLFDQLAHSQEGIIFSKQMRLENIIYRYPNTDRNSLDGLSLEINRGESIGLIGKSGAGKTTLVDVILGLLTPQSGDIKVDGNSIYNNLHSWNTLVGYVPQSIFLIDDTLERNIAFGVPDSLIDHERVLRAIEAAQLSDLIDELSHGLQTIIGERGVLLSGGQRQRIGIARALYHEREILVFDEATAALDNETEGLVTEAIKSLGGTKTIIIIAHRLSTIEHCDRIYLIEGGQTTKSGSYQDVVTT